MHLPRLNPVKGASCLGDVEVQRIVDTAYAIAPELAHNQRGFQGVCVPMDGESADIQRGNMPNRCRTPRFRQPRRPIHPTGRIGRSSI